jgi:hypothetical protein
MESFDVFVEIARLLDEEDDLWLAFYMSTMVNMERLSHSNFLSPSSLWSHLDDIVPKYDGDMTVLRRLHVAGSLLKTIENLHVSFVLSS